MSEDDVLMDRIADELRVFPHVDGEAKARLLVAVAAERERARTLRERGWRWFTPRIAVVGLAAAAVLAVYLRTAPPPSSPGGRAPVAEARRPPAKAADTAAATASMRPRPMQPG